jgi:hypothetical protein
MPHFTLLIERYKANAVKKYCLDNYLTLSRFIQVALINVFLHERFKTQTLDQLDCHIPNEMLNIIKSINPGRQHPTNLILQALDIVLERVELLPKQGDRTNCQHYPTPTNESIRKENVKRVNKNYESKKLNPPKCLKIKS